MSVIFNETIKQRLSRYHIQMQCTADVTLMTIIKTIFEKKDIEWNLKDEIFVIFLKTYVWKLYQIAISMFSSKLFQFLTNPWIDQIRKNLEKIRNFRQILYFKFKTWYFLLYLDSFYYHFVAPFLLFYIPIHRVFTL